VVHCGNLWNTGLQDLEVMLDAPYNTVGAKVLASCNGHWVEGEVCGTIAAVANPILMVKVKKNIEPPTHMHVTMVVVFVRGAVVRVVVCEWF
jgi:hypothetical protein